MGSPCAMLMCEGERVGAHLHTGGEEVLGVAGGLASPLAELLQVIDL